MYSVVKHPNYQKIYLKTENLIEAIRFVETQYGSTEMFWIRTNDGYCYVSEEPDGTVHINKIFHYAVMSDNPTTGEYDQLICVKDTYEKKHLR